MKQFKYVPMNKVNYRNILSSYYLNIIIPERYTNQKYKQINGIRHTCLLQNTNNRLYKTQEEQI